MIGARLLLFLAIGTGVSAAPAANAGLVLAAKVSGDVVIEVAGTRRPLVVDDKVPADAAVITAHHASAVLVFSNGTTVQLGADGHVQMAEIFQEPFSGAVNVAQITREPSTSRTALVLDRGELVAQLKILDPKSTFSVQTPFGAIRPRGDTATAFAVESRPTRFRASAAMGELRLTSPASGKPIVIPQGQSVDVSVRIDNVGNMRALPAASGK